jgi:hypothetical protein
MRKYLGAFLILAFGLVFFASAVLAGSLTVSWTLPTQNTDNSAIPLTGTTALASTRVEWGTCSGTAFGTKAGETLVNVPATTTTVPNLTDGQTYCFRAFSRNVAGAESTASLVVSKAVPVPTPKPPVIVTVATVVYEISLHPIEGVRLGRNVGTIRRGVACGPEPIVGVDYFEVPTSSVTLSKSPKSAVLVAQCG